MKMTNYLCEIRHACESIFPAVWAEHDAVEVLKGQITKLNEEMEYDYRQAQNLQQSENPDDVMAGVGRYWDTYFSSDKEQYHAEADLLHIKELRDVRTFACAAMSGAILQFARQGISAVYKDEIKEKCPDGRIIKSDVCLKTIIWEGRNQALHWEEKEPYKRVKDCFEKLKVAEPAFGDYCTRSLAFDVVRLLGWRDYTAFKCDMMSLT